MISQNILYFSLFIEKNCKKSAKEFETKKTQKFIIDTRKKIYDLYQDLTHITAWIVVCVREHLVGVMTSTAPAKSRSTDTDPD